MKVHLFLKLLCILCFSFVSVFANAGLIFTASLSGDQEVPPVATAASGMATAELTGAAGSYVLTYQIDYMDLSSPIIDLAGGGHFHNAPMGSNGGVVHLFDTVPFAFLGTTSGSINGDWRFDDAANPLTDVLANELMAGNIYINIHTENFRGGELRGQLTMVPEPSMLLLFGACLLAVFRRKT
ncbi:MAG: hypothetical protein Alis3KO_20730 [Aliiglaciecola sp.]